MKSDKLYASASFMLYLKYDLLSEYFLHKTYFNEDDWRFLSLFRLPWLSKYFFEFLPDNAKGLGNFPSNSII